MTGTEGMRFALARWGETAVAAALGVTLVWIGVGAGVSGAWLGWPVAAVGIPAFLWARAAWERATLPRDKGAPGSVSVQEGRIVYLAPEGSGFEGGMVVLEELWTVEAIELKRGAGLAWRLRPVDQAPLVIPSGADGVEELPEAFAALPGFSLWRAGRAFTEPGVGVRPIWRRPARVAAIARR